MHGLSKKSTSKTFHSHIYTLLDISASQFNAFAKISEHTSEENGSDSCTN